MNKPGSFNDLLRNFLLAGAVFFAFQWFLGRNNSSNQTPPRKAPTLALAFAGIDPATGGAPLNVTAANAEVGKLQTQVQTNPSDELAQWSRLRMALIQQYVLGTLTPSTRQGGFLGMGAKQTYFPAFDEIIRQNAGDAVEAQALYQEGDLLWRQSLQAGGQPSGDAVTAFESLAHKGRGAKFSSLQIYVPKIQDPAKVPLKGVPAGGFVPVVVSSLQGTLASPNPQGIVDRINTYYSTTPLYKMFDGMVNFLGGNPTYSYGFAILLFAVFTRSMLQPFNKKQYDSMKGMAVIAPEMKKIQERYKGKADQGAQMAQMKEIQALQRLHGVNPMLGCGLALIQMPIFFMLVSPMINHYEPKMELVGASFFWIASLARPDVLLLVLYGISMFFSFRLSSTPATDDMQRQQQMLMSYAMPLFLPFLISSYPAAFAMYWTAYNVLGTYFQWRLMKAADPSKNLLKTLIGDGLSVKNPNADAVAPRPTGLNGDGNGNGTSKSVKIQSKTPPVSLSKASAGLNGTIDGAGKDGSNGNGSNGAHKSAPDGVVLEPSAGEVERRKKKKK